MYLDTLTALHTTVGYGALGDRGMDALAWSFYGTTDGQWGIVHDASVFPLFAALHYLVRANGFMCVIESGTARGISTACLASAIDYTGVLAVKGNERQS
jgi:hypothetical protein